MNIHMTMMTMLMKQLGETDAWILCPFFCPGGRYTNTDVHYVADGNRLVPTGTTKFSKDAAFSSKTSNYS